MLTANLIPVIIEPIITEENDLETNIQEINNQIANLGTENVLAVLSTTSCFAPRGYDNIKEIAQISKTKQIYHIINNAYGIYCTKITDILNQSVKCGTVDVLISSTDKNFMVPVGGSLVYSSNRELVDKIKKNYPGRATISPILDLFVTLLDMGKNKYKYLIKDRKEKYNQLKESIIKVANKYSEKIIVNNNKISIAMTLTNICKNAVDKNDITYLGSLFFIRQISGIKIIAPSKEIYFNDWKFKNYGSHCENYPYLPYCSFACAIGITEEEINSFVCKFEEIIDYYISEMSKKINKVFINDDKTNDTDNSITEYKNVDIKEK